MRVQNNIGPTPSVIGSRACYVALKVVTVIFLCVCVCVRLFRDFLHCLWSDIDESSFRIGYRYVVVSPKVWACCEFLRGRSHLLKTVVCVKTISTYKFDRIGLSLEYVSLHWYTKLFSGHFFDRRSNFRNMTSWRIEQKSPDTLGTSLH